jgi:hypothetical protein
LEKERNNERRKIDKNANKLIESKKEEVWMVVGWKAGQGQRLG